MKNTTLLIIVVILIVALGAYFFGSGGTSVNANVIEGNNVQGDVQKVILSSKNLNYYPQEVEVKAGQPVSISLDSNVKGCLRAFYIRDLDLGKVLRTPQDTLDFTPTKKGTYTFSCSMGMGYGKLIVE